MAGLTPKQQRFVEEYLVDCNGKQAAIRCGYKPARAERTACELLTLRKVSEAVAIARRQLSVRTQRTVDDAMADIRRRGQLAENNGDFGPAIKAAELEAKHLGAFEVRVTHNLGAVTEDWQALLRSQPSQDHG
ncbi:MAG: terminase small subunit [Rubrivivax sp.]|nr:terminase small subunit [Rubrivivax sp.]